MAAPTYVSSAVYNQEDEKIIIVVSEDVASSIDTTGFTVSVNAGGDVTSALSTINSNIEIDLSVTIVKTDSITVAYAGGGDIESESDQTGLTIFTAQTITNNVMLDYSDADPTLLTGVTQADGSIDITYDSGDVYTSITPTQLKTPSILRTALEEAGLRLNGDQRGKWSIIKSARDSIKASL